MNLRKLFRQRFESKADLPKPLPAVVGDGAGNVRVDGRENYVYVRIGQSLAEAYCDFEVRHGESVLVGYDAVNPRLFRILGKSKTGDSESEIISSNRYRWAAPDGGQDPLMVELRQLLPARLGPAGGLKVSIYPGIAWCGTAWKLIGGSTYDLSTLVPTTSGKAKMVLFCVDVDGNVTTTTGNEVDISTLSINDLPIPPSGSAYALGAVRLYTGQSVIQEGRTNTDIVDLRFPVAVVRGGGDMLKAVYDTDNNGVVDAAESVDWSGVQNKPSTYPPSSHQHAAGDVISGVFDVARIPNLDASKITSGTLSTDRFSAWQDLIAEGKVLNSNLTIYLSPSGSDATGNGTQSNPYYSINRAMQDLKQIIANGYTVTIQLANGTYNYNTDQTLITVLGAFDYGQCRIIGNTSSPSSVVINFSGGNYGLFANGCLSQWQLMGFTIQGSVGQGLISSSNGSLLWVSSLIFGSSSSRHMFINFSAKIRTEGNYSITGGAAQHFGIFNGGFAEVYMRTITVSNNPNFSQAFLTMQSGAGFNSRFTTWSGSATGVRYTLNILCWADTAGYTLPGNQNGTVNNGSVYT